MDPFIEKYKFTTKGELNYCIDDGVAYQIDMTKSVPYDRPYFEKYVMYEKSPIGRMLNRARANALKGYADKLKILDVGIGCGTFIKYALAENFDVYGYDINPCGIHWLNKRCLFETPYGPKQRIMCYTFWDSLEHIPNPQKLLEKISIGAYVFISIPIFDTLEEITKSKHYRPDEHYYYFTALGLFKWMLKYNFVLRRTYNFEIECGREGIKTFLFERIALKTKGIALNELLKKYFKNERNTTNKIAEDFFHVPKTD